MKLMIRNLLYLFKRFKTAVVLNLFGLTIAFAAFLLIVMQVDYEMNYDAMHSKSGRTFRLEANHGEVRASDITDLPARHQVVQGSECLLYRGICVETVHMINVDMIRVQSS